MVRLRAPMEGKMKPDQAKVDRAIRMISDVFGDLGFVPPTMLEVVDDANVNAAVCATGEFMLTLAALDLPDEPLRAIIAHEVGHIALRHIYAPRDVYEANRAKWERDADVFAARYVGPDAMLALHRNYLQGDRWSAERISALEAMQREQCATA